MKIILVIMLLLKTGCVVAATAICTGTVTRIAFHEPDSLFLAVAGSNIFKVCSPQAQFNRTSPEGCKLLATLATTARATGKDIQVYVDNAPTTSCADITPWFNSDVRFMELLP